MLSRIRMTRAARVAVFVAVAAVLVSCSFTKIAYNQADTAAAWMVDDYFDLTGSQKTDFQERFARFHEWHRGRTASGIRTVHADRAEHEPRMASRPARSCGS